MVGKCILTEEEIRHIARCADLSKGNDKLVVFEGVPLLYCSDHEMPREATIEDLILVRGRLSSASLAVDDLINLVRKGSLLLGKKLEVGTGHQ